MKAAMVWFFSSLFMEIFVLIAANDLHYVKSMNRYPFVMYNVLLDLEVIYGCPYRIVNKGVSVEKLLGYFFRVNQSWINRYELHTKFVL